MEPRRKPSPQCVDLLEQVWQFLKAKSRLLKRQHTRRCFRGLSDTRMTLYEKIRGQKYRKEILPLGLGANSAAMGNRPLVGRDTLSDEHLIGTATGAMRSRAQRRLQEPARWVPAALNAILFTLNLPGRHRLQRPPACSLRRTY